MKNFLYTACAFACASAAYAAPITIFCGSTQAFANGVGTATVTCGPLDAGSGNKLINLSLTEAADASLVLALGTGGSTTARVVFGPPSSGPLTGFAPGQYDFVGSTVGGALTSALLSPQTGPIFNFGSDTQTLGSFTIDISSSLPNGGSVSQSTGTVSLTYDTMAIPSSQTPEPATLSLMGSALLGLGILRFRKQ